MLEGRKRRESYVLCMFRFGLIPKVLKIGILKSKNVWNTGPQAFCIRNTQQVVTPWTKEGEGRLRIHPSIRLSSDSEDASERLVM